MHCPQFASSGFWAQMLTTVRDPISRMSRHRRRAITLLPAPELLEERALLSSTGGNVGFDISAFAVPTDGDRITYDGMAFPGRRIDPAASGRALLSLVDSETDYQLVEVKHGLASSHARFQQMVDGLPVFGSAASTHQGPDGAIQTLHLDVDVSANSAKKGVTDLDRDEAVAAASHAVGLVIPYLPPSAEMVWFPTEDGDLRLSWQVNVSSVLPVGDFRTVIDASSGDVLFKENRIANVDGSGVVFEPNPYQTQGSGANLTDNGDATSAALEAQHVSVTLERLDSGTNLIKGEWVDLSTLNSPTIPDVDANEANRIYNYTRNDDRFEQVVIYDAVDSIQAYFHSLGFDNDVGVANGIRDYPTLANAHWNTDDQSFYSTADDAIHFGDGGVDDGEDADIIAHEYGHAVQHNQNANWGGGEMGAMGEGFGDYLAASFYATTGDAAFQAAHAACVGEWDATSYSGSNPPCLRRVDGNKMYPTDLVGAVHADGEIWSASLWDLRTVLGAAVTDQLVLEHHFALPANATMPVAAEAILTADANINDGANATAIRQAFTERGILEAIGTGRITLNASRYGIGETATISVVDSDLLGGGPINVTVVSTGGDTETVRLTETNGEFRGTIPITSLTVVTGNGAIEAAAGEQFTVTYNDAADNAGNPATVTDTATVFPYTEIANYDFSDDAGAAFDEGFTLSGTANEWHLSTGRGTDGGHTADDSFYFGSGEGVNGGGAHADNASGTLTSPVIDLTNATAAELMFNYFLQAEAGFDFARVSVVHQSGTTELVSSAGGGLTGSTSEFENARFDLAVYLGQSIKLSFQFTSDTSIVNEGWYIDDVIVRAAVPIVIPAGPDLLATVFDAATDHVLNAETDVTFTVTNAGATPSGAFETHVVWSPNSIVGDGDDVIVPNSTASFAAGLAVDASGSRTVNLQLDWALLLEHALDAGPLDAPVGTLSEEVSYLFLIVDGDGAVTEEDESNNSGVGKLIDSDDIAFFPWDTDGDRLITPLNALNFVRAVGTPNPVADINRDGVTSPFEALGALRRIGLALDPDLIEASDKFQNVNSGKEAPLVAASMNVVMPRAVVADSPIKANVPVAVAVSVATPLAATNDERRDDLFATTESQTTVAAGQAAEEVVSTDEAIQSVGDWLSLL